jgi:hypothetical protein
MALVFGKPDSSTELMIETPALSINFSIVSLDIVIGGLLEFDRQMAAWPN